MLKSILVFGLLLATQASFASSDGEEICGLLSKKKARGEIYVQYYLSFGTTPQNQQKMKLVARTDQVEQYLDAAYNNSAVCVIATAVDGEKTLLVDDIYDQSLAAPRAGRSN